MTGESPMLTKFLNGSKAGLGRTLAAYLSPLFTSSDLTHHAECDGVLSGNAQGERMTVGCFMHDQKPLDGASRAPCILIICASPDVFKEQLSNCNSFIMAQQNRSNTRQMHWRLPGLRKLTDENMRQDKQGVSKKSSNRQASKPEWDECATPSPLEAERKMGGSLGIVSASDSGFNWHVVSWSSFQFPACFMIATAAIATAGRSVRFFITRAVTAGCQADQG
eukprot:2708630-Amphidinium_carterae.1